MIDYSPMSSTSDYSSQGMHFCDVMYHASLKYDINLHTIASCMRMRKSYTGIIRYSSFHHSWLRLKKRNVVFIKVKRLNLVIHQAHHGIQPSLFEVRKWFVCFVRKVVTYMQHSSASQIGSCVPLWSEIPCRARKGGGKWFATA